MKKSMCMGLAVAMGVALSGCPIIGTNIEAQIVGRWEWVEAAAVLSQSTIDNIGEDWGYANETVAQNFADQGRRRKRIIFSDDGTVTYFEEVWRPDRQPQVGYEECYDIFDEDGEWVDDRCYYIGDGGAAVGWGWRLSLMVSGTYQLGPYAGDSSLLFSVPGLDTELFVDVDTYTIRSHNLGYRDDAYGRRRYEHTDEEVSSSDSNPLGVYALVGINPFDQLLVGWEVTEWKQFNYNVMGLEVYRRM